MSDVLTVHSVTICMQCYEGNAYLVTVNSEGTKIAQSLTDGALPTGNASSEADNEGATLRIILHTL